VKLRVLLVLAVLGPLTFVQLSSIGWPPGARPTIRAVIPPPGPRPAAPARRPGPLAPRRGRAAPANHSPAGVNNQTVRMIVPPVSAGAGCA